MNLDSNDKFIGHTDTRFNAENDRSLDLDKCKLYWRGGDSLIKVGTDVRARALGILGVNFCPGIRF